MKSFKRTTNAFNYVFEYDLKADEEVIVKMPVVSANKRGFNDVGWQSDGDVTLYGTLSANPKSDTALWQEIRENEEINKTVCAVKVLNNGDACKVVIRVIMC